MFPPPPPGGGKAGVARSRLRQGYGGKAGRNDSIVAILVKRGISNVLFVSEVDVF